MRRGIRVVDLGLIDFGQAFAVQERVAAEIAAGLSGDALLLLEHLPVYTMGSGGNSRNVLDPAVDVRRVNRGGDVTWHGPGQLVGYPLVDLEKRGRDLHRWLRFLEEVLISLAADFGVDSGRIAGRTGVWTNRGKLASIGVGVRRWVTMHGFSLNVSADHEGFSRINPCGIEKCPITSLEIETGRTVSIAEAKGKTAAIFPACLARFLPVRLQRWRESSRSFDGVADDAANTCAQLLLKGGKCE